MASGQKKFSILGLLVLVVIFGGMAYLSRGPYKAMVTIHELLNENKELKQAITNLTDEDQIGYAKVISQEMKDGKLFTTIKFGNKMVTDGKAKALYLWRRVYGEKMAPGEGYLIEEPGTEPKRYKDLLEALPVEHSKLFWDNIWLLANDTDKLKEYGIDAIYGNAVYSKLKKGLIYIFKITPTGDFYPEVVPDL